MTPVFDIGSLTKGLTSVIKVKQEMANMMIVPRVKIILIQII